MKFIGITDFKYQRKFNKLEIEATMTKKDWELEARLLFKK